MASSESASSFELVNGDADSITSPVLVQEAYELELPHNQSNVIREQGSIDAVGITPPSADKEANPNAPEAENRMTIESLCGNFSESGSPNDMVYSPTIEILVGPQEKKFYIHAEVLKRSKALGTMWLEVTPNGTYSIILAHEDFTLFRKIVQYLYTDTWSCQMQPCARPCTQDGTQCKCYLVETIMELYIRASRYQLSGLQTDLLQQISIFTDIELYLKLFKRAYQDCPGDMQLRDFFNVSLPIIWDINTRNCHHRSPYLKTIAECTLGGGEFAVDLATSLTQILQDAMISKRQLERNLKDKVPLYDRQCMEPNNCSGDLHHEQPNTPKQQHVAGGNRVLSDDENNTIGKDNCGQILHQDEVATERGFEKAVDNMKEIIENVKKTINDIRLKVNKPKTSKKIDSLHSQINKLDKILAGLHVEIDSMMNSGVQHHAQIH